MLNNQKLSEEDRHKVIRTAQYVSDTISKSRIDIEPSAKIIETTREGFWVEANFFVSKRQVFGHTHD